MGSGRTRSWLTQELPAGCLVVLPDLRSAASFLVTTAAGSRAGDRQRQPTVLRQDRPRPLTAAV